MLKYSTKLASYIHSPQLLYSSLDGPRRGDIQLSGVHDLKSAQMEEDNHVDHEYETIEKYTYMNTLPHFLPSLPVPTSSSPPLPADIGDCILDSCPAYGITTQGQSTSDELLCSG